MFAWRAFPSRGATSLGPAEPDQGSAGPGAYLTIPALRSAGIEVAFTTRRGGVSREPFASLDLSLLSGDDHEAVAVNRARVLGSLGLGLDAWTNGHQVHGAGVARVVAPGAGSRDASTAIADTDALWTDVPGVALAVLTADCVPVLLADPTAIRIGVVHAGWRGLVAGVIPAAIDAMGGPAGLCAFIGPSIGACCYEVGNDVAGPATEVFGDDVLRRDASRPHLDLWRASATALRRAGVTAIGLAALCTRCESHRCFSHRAGDGGRQGLVAAIARRS